MAIDQWKNPSDDKYILELMVCGAKLDKVNEETEVAPVHKVIKLANRGNHIYKSKLNKDLAKISLWYRTGGEDGESLDLQGLRR